MLQHVVCVISIVTDLTENAVRQITPLTHIKARNRRICIPNLQRQIVLTGLDVFCF